VARAFLGLGANAGNRIENLRLALRWLPPECTAVAISSLYASRAVVLADAPPGPDYLNAACEVATALDPQALLRRLKQIEHDIGRRPAPRWSPRPIDIDILLYGDVVLTTSALTIPHAGLPQRDFVLAPLAEIAGDVVHPAIARTVAELAADIEFAGLSYVQDASWAGNKRT
jgi:2-amino-4-hydroxy-6-hydroxymethyldihydropteridine diphosphokinase